ncbi:MAG: hypothetical protein M9933_08885, partial [Chitinophagaceae bacterium]|nr:hypothetical protein [Chitinophagaceae bacterium]
MLKFTGRLFWGRKRMRFFVMENLKRILPFSLINLALFVSCFTVLYPLFNSGDDVSCLYGLGGGYGFEPTALLNFNHILHPFISIPIKNLFIAIPGVNWYSVTLILFHYIATTIIFMGISGGRLTIKPLLTYLVIFLVFECVFLLSINFSNTSIILTFAGVIFWVSDPDKRAPFRKVILGITMFLIASLFRIHTLIPFIGVALPFILIKRRNHPVMMTVLTLTMVCLIIGLNQFHQYYYERNIKGWKQQEQYQQILYKYFNHRGLLNMDLEEWKTEREMLYYALTFDTSYLNRGKLIRMYSELTTKKKWLQPDSREIFEWFLINNRIYFFTFFLFVFFCGSNPVRILALISFGFFITGIGFLWIFMKLNDYVIVGGLGIICILILMMDKTERIGSHSCRFVIDKLLMGFLIFWACTRLYKIDKKNRENNIMFKNAAIEIKENNNF